MTDTQLQRPEFIGVGEAARYLGISPYKIAQLIRTGNIKAERDLLDQRRKLVRFSDVERLKMRRNIPNLERSDFDSAAA
jgi:excisionase family DNA binding protein